MKKLVVALSGAALSAAGCALTWFSPRAQSGDPPEHIIYCEPEGGKVGYLVCNYDSGGFLISKEEVACPKGLGANGEDCPPYIEPPGGEPYPPTHID